MIYHLMITIFSFSASFITISCKDGWFKEGDKGVTTLHFWMNYRIGNSFLCDRIEDFKSGLEYIDRALSLIPPLREGDIPHENEVMARIFRATGKGTAESGGHFRRP